MSGRPPEQIWQDTLDEGERRLARTTVGLAATAFAGGIEVLFGIVVMVATTGALTPLLGADGAHVVGSIPFGIAFVLITIGRAELFTENFLVPVGAVYAHRSPPNALLRMWVVSLVLNLAGLTLFALLFSVHGVLTPRSLGAAGTLADTYAHRAALPALLSAIAAGTVMTLFTWVIAAADSAPARVILAMLIGFVLGAPSLNHAIVSFGEIGLGLFAGTSSASAGDLFGNLGLAVVGNLIGGVGLVFATRLAQVRGEPGAGDGRG